MKILLGMSGGVDSCTAAAVLQAAGAEVTGVYLLLTPDAREDGAQVDSARDAAEKCGIPFFTADYRAAFAASVIKPFAESYAAGFTPNPCVLCNPSVKLAALLREADRRGIEKIATGHYARVLPQADGSFALYRAASDKDQSYFLCRLTQTELSRLVLPLGDFPSKEAVRACAARHGFTAADLRDSREICFLPDGEYAKFVCDMLHLQPKEGDFIDPSGKVLGRHRGIVHYTPGQRKGLGAFGAPRYVQSIRPADNTVTLCTAQERYADRLFADRLSWCTHKPPDAFRARVKIRSTSHPAPAQVTLCGDTATVRFDTPQLSFAPGQAVVFYDGEQVLGGGDAGVMHNELSE